MHWSYPVAGDKTHVQVMFNKPEPTTPEAEQLFELPLSDQRPRPARALIVGQVTRHLGGGPGSDLDLGRHIVRQRLIADDAGQARSPARGVGTHFEVHERFPERLSRLSMFVCGYQSDRLADPLSHRRSRRVRRENWDWPR